MKKKFYILSLLLSGATMFSSCSDNNDNGGEESRYKDRTFGSTAISDCKTVVNTLTDANEAIGSANLSSEQDTYLRNTLVNVVNNVIVPTYTNLANDVEKLESTLHGLNVNSISQSDINNACQHFKDARKHWEQSEAFLGGAASDFDVDPTIDSWPLNRTLLHSYFINGMSDEALEDQTILGFHALEFILFRNGQPRNVSELQGYDTYKNFTDIKGSDELAYAQTICTLLKQRCFQLQVAWEGETAANGSRLQLVKEAKLSYTTINGLSYGENLTKAGISGSKSTFPTLKSAIAQVLSDDEGSCAAIADEVGTAKIANPFSAGDISYVESPYSYNSITDFCDNIRSIRNVWLGSINGKAAENSFHGFFVRVNKNNVNTTVENAYESTISSIGNMPSPFVKYVSTIWNIKFEDDEDWD